ncbi:fungal-specific transcription factor domain-containing protein [Abortiporus biennis]|nr:fungal-specific transcription factor domain-containing protein [Abortiporus biennis]
MPPKSSDTDKQQNGEPKQRKRPGRVPVSCAECRRLKMRCDRKVPCETCVRRGCSAICPEALISPKSMPISYALADVEELHRKIERLRNRVHTLEDALRVIQSHISDDPHPLLQDDMVEDKSSRNKCPPAFGQPLTREDEEFLDAFGTLTLGLRGESRFFGQTSRSEYLLHAPESIPVCNASDFPHISPEMIEQSCMTLEIPLVNLDIKRQLVSHLPSLSRACQLCEVFLEHGEYLWVAPSRNQLFDEILGVIYRSVPHGATDDSHMISSHAFSLLFIIFSLASLMDPDLGPYSKEAIDYYMFSRVAMRFAPPVQDTTLWAIQALIYMAMFSELIDQRPSHPASHKSWINSGAAVKFGLSIGLHVNSARWKLDEEASQRRSRVFWQLFHQDTWLAFEFGRPPIISLAYVDCELPHDPEEHTNAEGQREWGFHPWTWQYTKLLHHVMTTAFGARTPQYSTVVDLDRRIRDFPIPWRMRLKCGVPETSPPTNTTKIQRWLIMAYKEATLLNLHRPYFAQALNEQPQDLLRHRYGPSVMAIYRSAWRLIEGLNETYKNVEVIMNRLSLPWSQALSAAIVMCLLVTRAPKSSLAQSALHELDTALQLFDEASERCHSAANHKGVIERLRRQAHDAADQSDTPATPSDELERIRGKTQLINANAPQTSASANTAPMSGPVPMESIHPTIMNDMRVFEGFQHPQQQQPNSGEGSAGPSSQPDLTGELRSALNFDFFQAFELPNPLSYRPFPETYLNEADFFTSMSGIMGSGGNIPSGSSSTPSSNSFSAAGSPEAFQQQQQQQQQAMASVPMLDASWQSFVEQLGF